MLIEIRKQAHNWIMQGHIDGLWQWKIVEYTRYNAVTKQVDVYKYFWSITESSVCAIP